MSSQSGELGAASASACAPSAPPVLGSSRSGEMEMDRYRPPQQHTFAVTIPGFQKFCCLLSVSSLGLSLAPWTLPACLSVV